MQILMGPQHTLIYIDESKMSTAHLFHFIENQFSSHHINNNNLVLTYSRENHYKHIFLIKWLYSLHKKAHNKDILNFKEVLVNRIEKPIKIITKKEIAKINTITLHISGDTLKFQLHEKNETLQRGLIFQLTTLITKISYEDDFFEINLHAHGAKNKLNSVLSQNHLGNSKILFQYEKDKLERIFEYTQENRLLLDALKHLNSQHDEPIDIIKTRYKKLLIQYHPDNVYTDGFEKIREYTAKFQTLQHSFELIQSHYR